MTADQYLRQLRTIKIKISNKRKEALVWRGIAESLGGGIGAADRVQASKAHDKISEAVAIAVDYEREADSLVCRLIELQRKIITQLDAMPEEHSLLLSEYYVHGMSIHAIAGEWERSYRHVLRKKEEALEAFEKKYGKNY